MSDSVNMSLDEIIKQNKQNRVSRSRGRGGGNGGNIRGRGGGRGRGRGGGGINRGRSRSRGGSGTQGRSQSRQRQGRSRSRQGQNRSRSRSQGPAGSRSRSRSRQQRRSVSRARSASRPRSMRRALTPKGRAGLEEVHTDMPHLAKNNRYNRGRGGIQNRLRGGIQNRLRRSNSIPNLRGGGIHTRLGVTTRRGAMANNFKPMANRMGISKRGRGFSTANRYSAIGLRSDQILQEQRQHLLRQNNVIRSQTFTRSRNNSFNNASQLTVSVANDFAARKRRNSMGSSGYLDKQSLAQLNNQFGGYSQRRGPGSVKSMGSNRSNRSSRSNKSNKSWNNRGRGGANRGVGRKFVNKQILNPKLQKEIAAIQGKAAASSVGSEPPSGVNFTPTPAATVQSLHQRFATAQ